MFISPYSGRINFMYRVLLFLWMVMGSIPFPANADHSPKIKIVGSTTVLPIASRAAERFKKIEGIEKIEEFKSSHRFRILVNAGGSGVGIHSVARGRSDIGMASREVSPSEKKRFEGSHLKIHTVGMDAVACVISSEIYDSGIHDLTRKEIGDIYLGKIKNWKEVGGPDRKIVVVDKERHRGTRHVFMNFIFGNPTAKTPGTILVTGSNNEEQAKIAQSNSAIGMLSYAWINDEVRAVGIRDNKSIVSPTREAIRRGDYPIVRNLSFITAGEPNGEVKAFLEYLKSQEGQQLVEESGYIPFT
jgi:phosphate transport system substrate-binding protein